MLQGFHEKLSRQTSGALLRIRMRRFLGGKRASFISSNCLGARLSDLAGEPYLSPTVGMFFRPHDYLTFVSGLPRYLAAEPVFDDFESQRLGFPVGNLLGLRLLFMHYPSFELAREKWMKRAALVDLQRTILVFSDRGGATEQDLKRFDDLPRPKLLFVARARPELSSAVRVPDGHDGTRVGDLFTHWQHLSPALTSGILKQLGDQLETYG